MAHDCQFAISHIQSKPHPLPLYCANANTGLKIFHCLIPQINPIYVTYSLKKLHSNETNLLHPQEHTSFISVSVPPLNLFCSPIMASPLPSIHEVRSHPTSAHHVL